MKKIIATFGILRNLKLKGELMFYGLFCLMVLSAVLNIYYNN